ncbi:hypothetical protein EV663_10533 [Rhodovulum bhavnagarense]|uniref:Uncharacterized protein n=1 Tax=Rhodovulum bhavnagarense TaxID=992286 RepID=A0A4R2RQ48_9RHOB|nr:hypothetical protein [Rhodovulum bhavnagarense]TCP61315.1 hypothetical protein EV663_10533 [Rhodovulum bhavnagarense]
MNIGKTIPYARPWHDASDSIAATLRFPDLAHIGYTTVDAFAKALVDPTIGVITGQERFARVAVL